MSETSGALCDEKQTRFFTGKSFHSAREKRVQIAEYSEMLEMRRFREFHKDSPRFLFNRA